MVTNRARGRRWRTRYSGSGVANINPAAAAEQ
jgi:hypothetical protein